MAIAGPGAGLSVLYVSPIKALLNNQQPRLERYYGLVGRRVARLARRRARLGEEADPGGPARLPADDARVAGGDARLGLEVDATTACSPSVRAVVVDEVHAFAGDDRGWHLLAVLERIGRLAGRDLQRIGLSATVGNADDLLDWLRLGRRRPAGSFSDRAIRPRPFRAAAPPPRTRARLRRVG